MPVDAQQPVPGPQAGPGGGAAGLDLVELDHAVVGAPGPDADAGPVPVEALGEGGVLALVVDGAPAVAAAADDFLRGLLAGLALGNGLGGGTGDRLAVGGALRAVGPGRGGVRTGGGRGTVLGDPAAGERADGDDGDEG